MTSKYITLENLTTYHNTLLRHLPNPQKFGFDLSSEEALLKNDGVVYLTTDGCVVRNGVSYGNADNLQFKITDGTLQFTINGEDWESIGSVVGPKGDTGEQGPKGADGSAGKDGRGLKNISLKSGYDVSPGTTSVYVITYTDNTTSEISIYNGTNGINGANGSDGITPKLKIEDGKWFASYDNEESWEEVGSAAGVSDKVAVLSENSVHMLSDGPNHELILDKRPDANNNQAITLDYRQLDIAYPMTQYIWTSDSEMLEGQYGSDEFFSKQTQSPTFTVIISSGDEFIDVHTEDLVDILYTAQISDPASIQVGLPVRHQYIYIDCFDSDGALVLTHYIDWNHQILSEDNLLQLEFDLEIDPDFYLILSGLRLAALYKTPILVSDESGIVVERPVTLQEETFINSDSYVNGVLNCHDDLNAVDVFLESELNFNNGGGYLNSQCLALSSNQFTDADGDVIITPKTTEQSIIFRAPDIYSNTTASITNALVSDGLSVGSELILEGAKDGDWHAGVSSVLNPRFKTVIKGDLEVEGSVYTSADDSITCTTTAPGGGIDMNKSKLQIYKTGLTGGGAHYRLNMQDHNGPWFISAVLGANVDTPVTINAVTAWDTEIINLTLPAGHTLVVLVTAWKVGNTPMITGHYRLTTDGIVVPILRT